MKRRHSHAHHHRKHRWTVRLVMLIALAAVLFVVKHMALLAPIATFLELLTGVTIDRILPD